MIGMAEISRKFHTGHIVMPHRELPQPPSGVYLSELLKRCMDLGLRNPTAKNFGEPWTPKTLANALSRDDKSISNYLKDKHPPRYPNALEMVFFGPDQEYAPNWRAELRAAHQRTREKWAKEKASTMPTLHKMLHALHENGPTIVGGIGIAQGVAHLIWNLTQIISRNPVNLWQKHWAYADIGFGIGGIVIGFACIQDLRWARKSGIVFCIAALFSAFLWFADEDNSDASRLLRAVNGLNIPVSLLALGYFVIGWPDRSSDG